MIGIFVNGRFLDIPPGATTSMERNTPLLLGDTVLGELMLPLTIPPTENNIIALGFITEPGKEKTATDVKVEAQYYEHGIFMYRGTLVVENTQTNLISTERGNISIYFLLSISDFYTRAAKVRLSDLNLGGLRQISNFVDHVKATWSGTQAGFDYVFAPVSNDNFLPPNPDQEFPIYDPLYNCMNPIQVIDGTLTLSFFSWSELRLVPFMYFKFLLVKCFSHFGFTISGEILDDPDFNKIILLNYQSIYWGVWNTDNTQAVVFDPVQFDLKNHVPKDYSVTRFLIAAANFFGWSYQFDVIRKHCTLVPLARLLAQSSRKDFTNKCGPVLKSEFAKQQKVYGLKLNFDGADTTISKPDLSKIERRPDVPTVADLEPASLFNNGKAALVSTLNWWYICRYNEDDKVYRWEFLGDNIYDYEPSGVTESIETAITPVSQRLKDWRRMPDGSYIQALLPTVNQTGNWYGKTGEYSTWEMRILFYHGMQPDVAASDKLYPFASSHNYNSRGQKVGNYSLSPNASDGVISRFWERWLKTLGSFEVVTFVLNLSMVEYMSLSWTDIILIRSVIYLPTQLNTGSPFLTYSGDDAGAVTVKALRVTTEKPAVWQCVAAVENVTVNYASGGIANVNFVESTPGANSWQYSIDGAAPITIYSHPFIIAAPPGNHTIVITPLCGIYPNASGAASASYLIPVKKVTITLSATLTDGNAPHNKMVLTAVADQAPADFMEAWSFEFGQCTVNTSIGEETCRGFIPYPGGSTNMTFPPGTTSVTQQSSDDTPGSSFGYITTIRIWGVSSPVAQLEFVKAPGQTWALSYN
ncbi:hypothetical protein SAMN05660461_6009 [Chitinophaga ginsengisegetis]|uniref:Uncharacterized protein n=1 Tax=Chitinophaga ginsengisegetis TaxID=393003 RepID=A0A1T5PCU7_9BACT|nr:hypothetical protein [Chitinophaga ginsengisegetis]SKD10109.1 hypothetical protein SAMN05660461_6009 [Chitinophaga ginsengisegetis]